MIAACNTDLCGLCHHVCLPSSHLLLFLLHSGQLLPEPGLHCHVCCVWNSNLSSYSGRWNLCAGIGELGHTPPIVRKIAHLTLWGVGLQLLSVLVVARVHL